MTGPEIAAERLRRLDDSLRVTGVLEQTRVLVEAGCVRTHDIERVANALREVRIDGRKGR